MLIEVNGTYENMKQKQRERSLAAQQGIVSKRLSRTQADACCVVAAKAINQCPYNTWTSSQKSFMIFYDDLQDVSNNHPRVAQRLRLPEETMVKYMVESLEALARSGDMPPWPVTSSYALTKANEEKEQVRSRHQNEVNLCISKLKKDMERTASIIEMSYKSAANGWSTPASPQPRPATNVSISGFMKPSPIRAVPPKKRMRE